MSRRVLAGMALFVAGVVLTLQAQPPAKPSPNSEGPGVSRDTVIRDQDAAARRYKEFEDKLLRMALRMEKSGRQEDRDKAIALRKAIELANRESIENRFAKLMTTLNGEKAVTLDELKKAADQNEELIRVLRDMLDILLTDDATQRLKEEQKRLTELLKHLDDIIRSEKIVQAKIDGTRVDNKSIGKDQNKVTKNTEQLDRAMNPKNGDPKGGDPKKGDPKGGDPKKGDPKGGDPKDGDPKDGDPKGGDPKKGDPKGGDPKKGDPKGGDPKGGDPKKGDPKGGDPKGGDPKGGDPKGGDPKNQDNPSQQNPNQQTPGKKQVQDAIEKQKQAEQELEKNKRDEAGKKVDEAITKLEEAKKELEKRLKQLREEEMERLLANLQQRCERMLAMQIEVYEGTKRVYTLVQAYPDKKPTRAEEQQSQHLSTREGEIVKEANKALHLLSEEGSAVAFAMTLESIRDDMVNVEKRLDKYDSGTFTQKMEEDIIAQLKEMIEALKKAQQQMKDNKNQPSPPPGGQPPPQRLLDMIAELKLLRSLQMNVNKRTKDYHDQYADKREEQTDQVLLKGELENLAKRQQKVEQALVDIVKGKNR